MHDERRGGPHLWRQRHLAGATAAATRMGLRRTAGSPPTGYGTIPWDDAMNLPGSHQVGLGKKLLEEYPWQNFQPHPEWAEFAETTSLSFEGCQWIWYPEGNPTQDAPAAKRFFRKTFVIPEGEIVERASLRISADDQFTAQLNGKTLGGSKDWHLSRQFNYIAIDLKPGTNVIAIAAENMPASGQNPAGLIACLEIHFANGNPLKLISDDTWCCAKESAADWNTTDFDDGAWPKALAMGRYGIMPWGELNQTGDQITDPNPPASPVLCA